MATNKTTSPATNQAAEQLKLAALAQELVGRTQLASKLGQSFSGKRDIYEACGYPKVLTFADYDSRYQRQDIAKRIVNAYPDATWRRPPQVLEDESDMATKFEKSFIELSTRSRLFHYVLRTDRIAGVGCYAILLLGFNDGAPLEEPVRRATDILYLQPYNEQQAQIHSYEEDPSNPRYGLPVLYNVKIRRAVGQYTPKLVHWTRVIHVADNLEDNDIWGTPRLKAVYNRLQDIETITAGSAEMFWKGGFPGFAFEAEADADMSTQDMDSLQQEISEYVHDLKRYMRVQGVNVRELRPQVANPSAHIEVQVNFISSATGIPKRILSGSELGKLASEQDKENWRDRVDERRLTWAEPIVMRQVVDRLLQVGVLPKVQEYIIRWPEIDTLSEHEEAEIAKIKSDAITTYANSAEAQLLFPPFHFYTKVVGFTPGEANAIIDSADDMNNEPPYIQEPNKEA